MQEKEFQEMILNDKFIIWLSKILERYSEIDNLYFLHKYKLNNEDIEYISYLKYLFLELNKYVVKHNIKKDNILEYYLKYNEYMYYIYYNGEVINCKKINNTSVSYIEYKDFKKDYKKNMEYNFKKLNSRVIDSLYNSDLEQINYLLSNINDRTLISGVGGSSVVSEFATKILAKKNRIITRNTEPRDFKYLDTSLYKNVLACSYSGNNYGVELAFSNNLKHYLLAGKVNDNDDIINLTYSSMDREKSFISLAATLIPCSILLNYYLNNEVEQIIDNLKEYNYNFDINSDNYEIFSGYDTTTASKYLESTLIESGIGIPIVHDKYSYCHGRSTLSTVTNNNAIYFNTSTELDKILLEDLSKYYKNVIVIECNNSILSEYQTLIKCMYLTKYIAELKEKDLSNVKYNPVVKKLYKFKGEL